jgi:hypothetical protein
VREDCGQVRAAPRVHHLRGEEVPVPNSALNASTSVGCSAGVSSASRCGRMGSTRNWSTGGTVILCGWGSSCEGSTPPTSCHPFPRKRQQSERPGRSSSGCGFSQCSSTI